MRILAIETVTESCSVALMVEGKCEQHIEVIPNGHSQLVHEMIAQLLKQCALGLSEIDVIAVDIGPGSFTGVRIGIGVAQGLAYGAQVKTVGISSLAALSMRLSATVEDEAPESVNIFIPALDARMQQIYWGLYDGSGQCLVADRVDNPETLEEVIRASITKDDDSSFVAGGSGWHAYSHRLPDSIGDAQIVVEEVRSPEARDIAVLAAKMPASDYVSPEFLMAAYVRNNVASKAP